MFTIFSQRIYKFIAVFLLLNITLQLLSPLQSFALTSGPSQPEVQSFEPVGTTEMVDLFTGDFAYNVPLFELPGPNGGYPFNLHYNSGITMDQEASWVGLGWNLNPGAINRQMRGLPDDFSSDIIQREMDMKPNETTGGSLGGTFEVFGADQALTARVSLGLGIYYNNYKGVGYNIDAGISMHSNCTGNMDAGLGLNLSLDSQEGAGVSPSLSLLNSTTNNNMSYNVGVGFNSRRGLTGISMGLSGQGKEKTFLPTKKNQDPKLSGGSFGGQSVLSFASQSYSPQVSMPMQGRNVSLSYKVGGSLVGTFTHGYINGYYTTQRLKSKRLDAKAYGYMYLHKAGEDDLLDFNREKDGMIRKNSPNLPIPAMTFDAYSVAGQGIGGMYRAYRSDVGALYDQQMSSETFGGAGGYEVGIGYGPHIGGNLTINYAKTSSGKWIDENEAKNVYRFEETNSEVGNLYEPYYFKTYGEHTTDTLWDMSYVGDSLPVRISILAQGDATDPRHTAKTKLERKDGGVVTAIKNVNPLEKREPRNLSVQPISNKDLIDESNGEEILKEYKVKYFTSPSASDYRNSVRDSLRRKNRKEHHTAGISALNPDGTRYVYGLPAYNNTQTECQFSVAPSDPCSSIISIAKDSRGTRPNYKIGGTEEYYNRTTVPEYAHSYLLTAILGSDYIDADNIPGPSVGDIGYWVKFNYVKTSSAYKWRVPFLGANYMQGYRNNTFLADDKGSYTYGTKEVWHLATAETKSHIASFTISPRKDGRGAASELQNPGDNQTLGDYSYKLDKISIFARSEYERTSGTPVPIKNVFFDYTYDLCTKVPNSDAGNPEGNVRSGKLTLKKVWFTDGTSTRGALSPYVFNYNETSTSENPYYSTHKYDRWGSYKPYRKSSDSVCYSMDMPYVNQFDGTDPNFKNTLDKNMAAWNLKSIKLPSGATIDIKYESDDYAYVQNKPAMQMFRISSLATASQSRDSMITPLVNSTGSNARIYFALEQPISSLLDTATIRKEVAKYLDGNKLYYKVYVNLLESDQNYWEYVSGYADVTAYGVDLPSKNTSGNYTRAYVQLGKMKVGGKTMKYHPFCLAAWQHLRTTQPDLMNVADFPKGSSGGGALKALVALSGEVKRLFAGFYDYCATADKKDIDPDNDTWGRMINLNKSFIRLNSPDKIKYGGGVRVKEIVLKDNWDISTKSAEQAGITGQVYDYTIDEDGQTISSGVAAYEPLIGGDEIALRNAKDYSESMPLMTPNNLYFEYPVNESYYPGPTVGYRKVKVRSIATQYTGKTGTSDPYKYKIPSGISTTGETVHEFYTAKDFPVIADETDVDHRPFKLFIPIPLLGQVTVNNLTSSQGYSLQLNDMHGKLKKVSNYAQDKNGNVIPEPISWVKYNYQCTPFFTNSSKTSGDRGPDYYVLNNKVNTLISDKNGIATLSQRYIGTDYDFFTDMRQGRTFSAMGGLNLNTDVVIAGIFPFPVTLVWPNVGTSTTQVRTAVTNKIIHKSGILSSIEAYDGSSLVRTDNRLFDALTGQPVLTTVTNDYEDPIYNYNLPAHMVYDGMGPAYKNSGLNFSGTVTAGTGTNIYELDLNKSANSNVPWRELVPGDEFIIDNRKGVFSEKSGNVLTFYIEGSVGINVALNFLLVRSGRRNHLSTTAGNVTALTDPSNNANRKSGNCSISTIFPQQQTQKKRDLTTCAYEVISAIRYLNSAIRNSSFTYSNCPSASGWGLKQVAKSSLTPTVFQVIWPMPNSCGVSCGSNAVVVSVDTLRSINEFGLSYSKTDAGLTYYGRCPISSSYYVPGTCTYYTDTDFIKFFVIDNNTQVFIPVNSIVDISTPFIDYSYSFGGNTWDNSEDFGVAVNLTYYTPQKSIITRKAYIDHNLDLSYLKFKTDPTSVPVVTTGSESVSINFKTVNNVISASAGVFSQSWSLDNGTLRGNYWTSTNRDNFYNKNAYLNGSKGVWKASESYTYVKDRKQSNSINLRTDGAYDSLPLFDWDSPVHSCDGRWRKINTITDYSPYTYETENKDLTGISSAALYGYTGDLITAVAGNARTSEIAFEGFEEFESSTSMNTPSTSAVNINNYGSGNFMFFTQTPAAAINSYNTYQVLSAKDNYLIIDKPYDGAIPLSFAEVNGYSAEAGTGFGKPVSGKANIIALEAASGNTANTLITLDPAQFKVTGKWIGSGKFKYSISANIPYTTIPSGGDKGIYVSSGFAHTGKQSLCVRGIAEYEQRRLSLNSGKKYVFSCWVSGGHNQSSTFGPAPYYSGIYAYVKFKDINGNDIIPTTSFYPSGSIIGLWQKVEGEFTVPANAASMIVGVNGGSVPGGVFNGYFDDIRIHPSNAGMKSYVYNKTDYKLKAILDENNYATLYHYDGMGNLFLVEQETEKGVRSIQESVGHQKEN